MKAKQTKLEDRRNSKEKSSVSREIQFELLISTQVCYHPHILIATVIYNNETSNDANY